MAVAAARRCEVLRPDAQLRPDWSLCPVAGDTLAGASAALVVFGPFMLLIAAIIRLTSRGPALFMGSVASP